MNKWIQIWYSWGDQEAPVKVPEGTGAWAYAKKLAIDEVDNTFLDRDDVGEMGIRLLPDEGKIVLRYPYDGEYCYYLITDTEDYKPDEDEDAETNLEG